ncbi:MAG: hypothetical protein RLZZ440_1643 [Planctomycetota bacterium]|jgi:hypothetical protein
MGVAEPQGRGRRLNQGGHMQQEPAGRGDLAFGFLTAVDSPAHGLFGGYLVVDGLGRPLEFHCTAPVKVSRAQQILYGPTLHGHLHGQQIGGALLAEGKAEAVVVLTDLESMLHVRPHTSLPVALVQPAAAATGSGFVVGDSIVSPHATDAPRALEIEGRLAALAAAVDLREPFERIRAALDEAQRH